MTLQTPDMQAMLERLEKLERQNRTFKRVGLLTLAAIASLVLMGQAPGRKPADTITARHFVLEGPEGQAVGNWFTTPDAGPVLVMSQPGGHAISAFSAGGIKLEEHVEKKDEWYVLTTAAHAPSIELRDNEGFVTTIGVNTLTRLETGETARTSAASVIMSGKDGKVIWRAP